VHLTKEPRYFTGIDEIREEYSERVQDRQQYAGRDIPRGKWSEESGRSDGNGERGILGFGHKGANPLGKLPGSVWTIPTQPLRVPWGYGVQSGRVARYFTHERDALGWLRLGRRAERRRIRALPDHFAAFPLDWPLRLIGDGPRPGSAPSAAKDADRPAPRGSRAIEVGVSSTRRAATSACSARNASTA
jgi:hypothetical protein